MYVRSQEHSWTNPYYRTWKVYCFNAVTGDRIWDLNGGWSGAGFSDGYMASPNFFDNLVYCIGKGPSEVTVEAPLACNDFGEPLIIQGSVMDISAGTKSSSLADRFPHGVPAVSEDSMTGWMEHVYMQKSKPTDVTGVKVKIDVLDSNGNYRNIGETTSDANGFFSFDWTPDIDGKYTVYARFEGSESYWPSNAVKSFVVNEALPTPTAQPVIAQSQTEMYVIGVGVAIIIAIAILGLLLLRKHP